MVGGQSQNSITNFENVDLYTLDSSTFIVLLNNDGLYTSWIGFDSVNNSWTKDTIVNIKNADVYVNITGQGYNAVFFGGGLYYGDGTISNSNYYGKYYGESVNLILGNATAGTSSYAKSRKIVATNVKNEGILAGIVGTPLVSGRTGQSGTESDLVQSSNVEIGNAIYLYDKNLNVSKNDTGVVLKAASSEKVGYYELSFTGGTRFVGPASENSSFNFRIKVSKDEFENGSYQTTYQAGKMATVKQYKDVIDSNQTFDNTKAIDIYGNANGKLWIIKKNSVIYYVFDFNDNDNSYFITKKDNKNDSSIVDVNKVCVVALDKDGIPIAQTGNITLKNI